MIIFVLLVILIYLSSIVTKADNSLSSPFPTTLKTMSILRGHKKDSLAGLPQTLGGEADIFTSRPLRDHCWGKSSITST